MSIETAEASEVASGRLEIGVGVPEGIPDGSFTFFCVVGGCWWFQPLLYTQTQGDDYDVAADDDDDDDDDEDSDFDDDCIDTHTHKFYRRAKTPRMQGERVFCCRQQSLHICVQILDTNSSESDRTSIIPYQPRFLTILFYGFPW